MLAAHDQYKPITNADSAQWWGAKRQLHRQLLLADFAGRIWDEFPGEQGNVATCPDQRVCVLVVNGGELQARVYDQARRLTGVSVIEVPPGPAWTIAAHPQTLSNGAQFAVYSNVRRADKRGKAGEDGFEVRILVDGAAVSLSMTPVERRLSRH
jgi:hypothetical protein